MKRRLRLAPSISNGSGVVLVDERKKVVYDSRVENCTINACFFFKSVLYGKTLEYNSIFI